VPARPELDVERILGVLTSHGVDFVVIGGVAALLHGSATFTQDVDVCFATDETNLTALGRALLELDARLRGL
jgi:predicted nucleotidyltransferase